ncbi:biotin/lipoate--protein ligase family protein [Pacificispira sp.]|uniref:biotin/lipoate--protein ligase family protein n=1 Tax=Pacificispira sp. TaxID=2888761 RepID=UPI003B52897F
MTQADLTLPPLLTPMGFAPDADLPNEALYRARRGRIDPGTVCYSERPDQLDAILMLAPDTPLGHAIQVIYPMSLAGNDALGAIMPPGVAVHMAWPDRFLVNGALAGGVALYCEQDDLTAEPDWMLARIRIDIMGAPHNPDPGRRVDRTSLYEEGAGDASAPALLQAYCRHFMNWLDRWQRGGLDAVAPAWMERAGGREEDLTFPAEQGLITGRVAGLSPTGDLQLTIGDATRILPLSGVLEGPSWEL